MRGLKPMSPLFLLANVRRMAAVETIDFRHLRIISHFYTILSVVVICFKPIIIQNSEILSVK